VAEEILSIKYMEHPQVDSLNLRGEVHYPNLSFETMVVDFGCILNDTEVIRYITITNCSPLVVKFRWFFLVGDEENQIRYHGHRKSTDLGCSHVSLSGFALAFFFSSYGLPGVFLVLAANYLKK
jgi:hypothetical protein